jgi:thiamine pyrophosphokinase
VPFKVKIKIYFKEYFCMDSIPKKNEFIIWTLVGPMGPEAPLDLLKHSVIAVDGGAMYTSRIDTWTGDSDSYTGNPPGLINHTLPREKARSDLGHALDLITHFSRLELHLWGFLGGRRDHEMINFGEIIHFSNSKDHLLAVFYGSNGKIQAKICSRGNWTFEHQGLFSVISYEDQLIQMSGNCKYVLEKPTQIKAFSSQTLSNEAFGLFNVSSDKSFMILFNDEE